MNDYEKFGPFDVRFLPKLKAFQAKLASFGMAADITQGTRTPEYQA